MYQKNSLHLIGAEDLGVPPTLKTLVLNRLRDAIVSGRYRPGDRLNESKLAREFTISRIPIREALISLEEQGLVTSKERRGMFVTILPDDEVQKMNNLRIILESEALRLCRLKMTAADTEHLTHLVEQVEALAEKSELTAAHDLEFYRQIWRCSGNGYLARILDGLVTALYGCRLVSTPNLGPSGASFRKRRAFLNVALGKSNMSPEEAVKLLL